MTFFSLFIPAFIAGILTFLAPCTLPLLPVYLGFLGGASLSPSQTKTSVSITKLFLNSLLYVAGLLSIFLLVSIIFTHGIGLLGTHRIWFTRLGGILVIAFGLSTLEIIRLPFLNKTSRFALPHTLKPGQPLSSFLFGAAFGFSWSPCLGPVMASILLLVSTRTTATEGMILLMVFCLGFALPFLAIALGAYHAKGSIHWLNSHTRHISLVSGLFLIGLGCLMLAGDFDIWITWVSSVFAVFPLHVPWMANYL